MTKLLHKDLTHTIIGVYYDVYNGTARTYPEFIYERAMMHDLRRKDISCQQQKEYQVLYKDKLVGSQRLDLLVGDEVAVEIKVAPRLTDLHKAQAFSYLKVANKEVGLLCNFGGAEPDFERLYFKPRSTQGRSEGKPPPEVELPGDPISPELADAVIGGLFEVHTTLGPGFIHRIYANAIYHELLLRGLEALPRREYQVIYHGRSVGEIKFNHLQIEGKLMVFPIAIQDIKNLSINNLKAWMGVQGIPLGIVANFFPARLELVVLRTQ
jgi:GxxExxY protein